MESKLSDREYLEALDKNIERIDKLQTKNDLGLKTIHTELGKLEALEEKLNQIIEKIENMSIWARNPGGN